MNNEVFGTGVTVQAKVDGDWITIGCAASCGFRFQNELIGKTDANSGLFRKKRVRISDCSGNVAGVMTTASTPTRLSVTYFLQEGIRRSEIEMQFIYEANNGDIFVLSGLFLVETIGLDADINAFAEFDMNLQGTGGVTISEIEPPGELVCEGMFSDWWPATEGATSISGTGHNGLSFAGKNVLLVLRTGTGHELISTGTPGNLQAKYTGGSSISIDPTNPFNAGEDMIVVWTEDES